jgi:hypothetical protein
MKLLLIKLLQKFLISLHNYKVKKPSTLKKIGPMMNQSFCSGLFKNIVEERIFSHKSLIKMIGWRLLDSFLEEMTHNANTSLTKIKSLLFKKAIG